MSSTSITTLATELVDNICREITDIDTLKAFTQTSTRVRAIGRRTLFYHFKAGVRKQDNPPFSCATTFLRNNPTIGSLIHTLTVSGLERGITREPSCRRRINIDLILRLLEYTHRTTSLVLEGVSWEVIPQDHRYLPTVVHTARRLRTLSLVCVESTTSQSGVLSVTKLPGMTTIHLRGCQWKAADLATHFEGSTFCTSVITTGALRTFPSEHTEWARRITRLQIERWRVSREEYKSMRAVLRAVSGTLESLSISTANTGSE